MNRAVAAATVAAALVAAPGAAAADPTDLDAWHEDLLLRAVIPLGPSAYKDHAGFGGAFAFRAYHRMLEAMGEATLFTRSAPAGISEVLGYRLRALAGYRHTRELSSVRAVIFRVAGGVELGGFDDKQTSDFAVEEHRFGGVLELGFDSRSALDWGGVVTLSIALGITAQPFGDADNGEADYVGVELLAGASIGL
jgi:hypothetical protein